MSEYYINSLLHCTKRQFLEFVQSFQDEHFYQKSTLSKFSQSFIVRVKLSKNWSFDVIAACFVISKKTARRIFWHLLHAYFRHSLTFPDLLNGGDEEIEEFFEQVHDAEDPFYRTLFGNFKDPRGRCILYII